MRVLTQGPGLKACLHMHLDMRLDMCLDARLDKRAGVTEARIDSGGRGGSGFKANTHQSVARHAVAALLVCSDMRSDMHSDMCSDMCLNML